MSKENSNKITQQFYDNLRRQIRRFDPGDFSIMASNILRASLSNMDLMSHYPPHFLLHAIEANCRYYDPCVKRVLDRHNFNKVINVYHDYKDPYQQHELQKKSEEGVFNLLISMAVNQFPIQRHLNYNIFGRSIVLFHKSENLECFRNLFYEKYGLPIKDWLILTFAVFSWFTNNETVVFQPENFSNSEVNLPIKSLEPFLKSTSMERKEVSDNFNLEIEKFPPFLNSFVKSTFFDFPFLRYSSTYINPHPNLLSYLAHERIYKIMSEISSTEFQTAFGKTFEEFINMLIDDLTGVRILKEKEIKDAYQLDQSEVCDFLIEFTDCFLLIEVKAVQYTKRFLSLASLTSANSSKKIAKAYEQLFSVGKAMGEFTTKKLLSICVTFGQMFFPNLDTYYQKAILPNMSLNVKEIKDPFVYPPQTLSIDEFEEFIAVIDFNKMCPLKLFGEMSEARSVMPQSWHTFLSHKYRSEIDSHKSVISKQYYNFFVEQNIINSDFDRSI